MKLHTGQSFLAKCFPIRELIVSSGKPPNSVLKNWSVAIKIFHRYIFTVNTYHPATIASTLAAVSVVVASTCAFKVLNLPMVDTLCINPSSHRLPNCAVE